MRSLLVRMLEEHVNGAPPPDPAKFFIILTASSNFTDASTLADILKLELPESNGYSRKPFNPGSGSYDATQTRYELPPVTATFTASGAGLQFDRAVIISNAHATANKVFTATAATNSLTVTAHGLTNGDIVVPTADAGGTIPTGMSAIAYYAKSIDANTIELYTDSGLATIVDFSNAGSGTLRLRYASGEAELYDSYGTSTIPSGSEQSLIFSWNIGGSSSDVNAP